MSTPSPQPPPAKQELNLGKGGEQDGKEKDQLQKNPEYNTAFRVFWKSREWRRKVSTYEFDEAILTSLKKKYLRKRRRKRKRLLKNIDRQEDEEPTSEQLITFPCFTCKHEIDPPGSFFHKKQHIALTSLGFYWMGEKKPLRSEIVAQRRSLITNLLSSFTFSEKALQIINNAFELVWKKQVPEYYKIIDNIAGSSVYPQQVNHLLIKGVAICEDRNSAWRTTMEDKFTVVNSFGNKSNVCFLGLFDGHCGVSAADLASMELPVLLLHQISRFDPSYQMTPEQQKVIDSFHTVFKEEYIRIEDRFTFSSRKTKALHGEFEAIHKAFAKAFWRMDRLLRLGRNEASNIKWSGCSALVCILESSVKSPHLNNYWRKQHVHESWRQSAPFRKRPEIISGVLHVANAGNVQAVLCRNGKGFCLTKEHTMQNKMERRRVLQNGAIVTSGESDELLEGQMKTTRGLGFHGNPKLKKCFIPAPQTISVPIDDLCQFLVLATNGLWEVLDKNEVIPLAISMFHTYKEKYSIPENVSSPPKPSEPSVTQEECTNIHVWYQCTPLATEYGSVTNSQENLCDSEGSQHSANDPKNLESCPPKLTLHQGYSREKIDGQVGADSVPTDLSEEEKEPQTWSFYERAAQYVSQELVNAALTAGSRDNITVVVILFSGSEYQFRI